MDKRSSFVFARQYRNCFSRRINALVPRNPAIKTADIHGLMTMTFHHVADIEYFLLAFTEIVQFFSRNVTPETYSKTQLKTEQIQDC